MKTNFIYISSVLLLLLGGLFSGCKDTVGEEPDGYYPIVFEATIDPQFLASTRGARLTASSLSSFGVFGFADGNVRVRNVSFTKTNDTWRGSRTISWAPGAMDFYGLSPSFSVSSGVINTTMNETPKNVEYESPDDVDAQVDLMYSSIYNLKRTDNNGKVAFSFKPAMHYISYMAKNSITSETPGTEFKVYIKEIILHNIVSNGTFVYNTSVANMGSWTIATGEDAKYVNMRKVFPTPKELTSTMTQMMGEDYLIMIPQACKKWNTTADNPVSIAEADADHKYYIETVAQIVKVEGTAETYLLGYPDDEVNETHPKYESVYFPVASKTYRINTGSTLSIDFNGGYNKDGKPYLENLDRGGGDGVIISVSEWMNYVITPEEWVPLYENLSF